VCCRFIQVEIADADWRRAAAHAQEGAPQ
jgi:hypothetical protein